MKKIVLLIFFSISQVLTLQARAQGPAPASSGPFDLGEIERNITIPEDKDVLVDLGPNRSNSTLPNTLRVLTWNIHKGLDQEKWQKDFLTLAAQVDLFSIQEAVIHDPVETTFKASNLHFIMAQSFIYSDGRGTGVATGAVANALQMTFLRSPGTEPIMNSPKMSLVSIYPLQDGSKLMVVNIHAINFVGNSDYSDQLEALTSTFRNWTGPTLFLGDFNTWNFSRMQMLRDFTIKVGLKLVTIKNDPRYEKFDAIFYKGCMVNSSHVYDDINTSDHKAVGAELTCSDQLL
jgi:endonuclease/exonuclease/phosphatase (EEP) superfamily protein YafD